MGGGEGENGMTDVADFPEHPFSASEAAVISAALTHAWRWWRGRGALVPLAWGFAANLVVVAQDGTLRRLGWPALFGLGFLGWVVFSLVVAGVLMPLLTWWQARRHYRSNPAIFSAGRYAITDTGWKVSVPGMQGETAFSSMIGWAENREVFLLYLTRNMYQIVPKRMLAPGDDALLRSRLAAAGVAGP